MGVDEEERLEAREKEKRWGWNANFLCLFRAAGFGMDDMNDELCCTGTTGLSASIPHYCVWERIQKEREKKKQQQQPGMFPLINPHTSTSPATTNGTTLMHLSAAVMGSNAAATQWNQTPALDKGFTLVLKKLFMFFHRKSS